MALPTGCGGVAFGHARGLSQPRSPCCFEALRGDGARWGIRRGAPLGKEGKQAKRRRSARRPSTQSKWQRVLRDWRLFAVPALSFHFPLKQPKEQSRFGRRVARQDASWLPRKACSFKRSWAFAPELCLTKILITL
ncbi:hypothetical protein ERJ75_000228300 [Trypanosoma vivax]|nr:hypothetical protein ERJ75_000228300 [Trypanosoma vivax]